MFVDAGKSCRRVDGKDDKIDQDDKEFENKLVSSKKEVCSGCGEELVGIRSIDAHNVHSCVVCSGLVCPKKECQHFMLKAAIIRCN